jgi:competence protein ComEC
VLEDASYSYNGQLETAVSVTKINNQPIHGKMTLRGYEAALYRHDFIEATGKLRDTRGGKQGTMSYADITVLSHSTTTIETLRRNFIVGMQNALPEPAASLGVGILVGQRSLLPDDVSSALQIAGLTHIVAVSGYNLTIIINAVRRLSRKLSRFQTVGISSGLLYGFLLITGFSPSIVRASLVAGLGLAAWYYGREIRPIVLIMFVAAVTGFVNPYYVWGDIGWYLSFLAFFGVLVIAPLVIRIIAKNKKELPLLPTVAIESFAAQIMTLPLLMYVFSKISLVGFVANSVIVPFIPFAMLTSFIAGISGMISPILSGWVGLPARVVLNAIINVATWMSELPHAIAAIGISAPTMIALYCIIGITVFGLKKRAQSVIIKESK